MTLTNKYIIDPLMVRNLQDTFALWVPTNDSLDESEMWEMHRNLEKRSRLINQMIDGELSFEDVIEASEDYILDMDDYLIDLEEDLAEKILIYS